MKIKTFLGLVLLFILLIIAVVVRIGPTIFTTKKTVETIDDSTGKIYESSLFSYVEAVELAYTLHKIEENTTLTNECDINKNTLVCKDNTLDITIRGSIPESGKLYFNEDGKVIRIDNALINGYICNYDGSNYKCIKEKSN